MHTGTWIRRWLGLWIILAAPTPAFAQFYVAGNVGFGEALGRRGAILAGAVGAKVGPVAVFLGGDGLLYKAENDRYYTDTFSNGQQRCRDRETGQFAKDELCSGTAAIYGGMFDGNALIPFGSGELMLGGGYRAADESTPYGAIGFAVDRFQGRGGWYVRGIVGRDFYQAHIGGVLNLGSGRQQPRPATVSTLSWSVTVPEGMQFVASSRGRVYYWAECSSWRRIPRASLRFFASREEAESAGYAPSRLPDCAGPADPPPAAPVVSKPASAGNTEPTATGTLEPSPAQLSVSALQDVCTIARVIDGDTVECAEGERVRLVLIDAPEMSQSDYGLQSKILLETILPAGTTARVELDVQERDRYGRVLAYLYAPDGTMINEEMVGSGYAVVSVYPPNVMHVERIRAAQTAARVGRYGLWSGSAFECRPADHRAGRCE